MANKWKSTARARPTGERTKPPKENGRKFDLVGDLPFCPPSFNDLLLYELARESKTLRNFAVRVRKVPRPSDTILSPPSIYDLLPLPLSVPPGDRPADGTLSVNDDNDLLRLYALTRFFIITGFPEVPWRGSGAAKERWLAAEARLSDNPAVLAEYPMMPLSLLTAYPLAPAPDVELLCIPGPDATGKIWEGSQGANIGGFALRLNLALPDAVLMDRIKPLLWALRQNSKIPNPNRARGRPANSGEAVNNPRRVCEAIVTVCNCRTRMKVPRRYRPTVAETIGREVANPHEVLADARKLLTRAVETHLAEPIRLAELWQKQAARMKVTARK